MAMTGSLFKTLVNFELDTASFTRLGRQLDEAERAQWWTSPQGGIAEPYLLVVAGSEAERRAVIKAAREWTP